MYLGIYAPRYLCVCVCVCMYSAKRGTMCILGASEIRALRMVQVKPERIHASPVNAVAQTLEQETGFLAFRAQGLGVQGLIGVQGLGLQVFRN